MSDSSPQSTVVGTPPATDRRAIRERRGGLSDDEFLAHYFKRIDPRIAESFTPQQRAALVTMFAGRGVAKHRVEIRRTIPFGRRRYYLVFLMGRERRAYERLFSEGEISHSLTWVGYLATAALWLTPVILLAVVLQTVFGISLLPEGL